MSAGMKLKEAKSFSVFVVWASLLVSYTQYGAIDPLLPYYVKEFPGMNLKVIHVSNHSTNSNNGPTKYITKQSGKASVIIGALLGTSKVGQLLISPVVGMTINKIGYDIPLFIGYALQIGASLGFGFVDKEVPLFVLRVVQGMGCAFINTAGFTIVADLYQDDDATRGKMISYVMCGISLGFLVGPPFGSTLYQVGSKLTPFVTISAMMLCVALMRLYIRLPRVNPIRGGVRQASSLKTQLTLLKDPYMLICLLLIISGMIGIGFLEATLPNHMLLTMDPEKWMLGIAFLPLNAGLIIGNPILNYLTTRTGRWIVAFICSLLQAGPYVAYAFCRNFIQLLLPAIPLGFLSAATDAAVLPALAYFVHTRHGPGAYGAAYALTDMALSIAYGAGPVLGGVLVPLIGFDGLMYLSAAISIVSLVPLAFLRKPIAGEKLDEEKPIIATPSDDQSNLDQNHSRNENEEKLAITKPSNNEWKLSQNQGEKGQKADVHSSSGPNQKLSKTHEDLPR